MGLVYIGADHRGYYLKEKIKKWLGDEEYQVSDLGNEKYDPEDDYPEIAIKLAERVVAEGTKGILLCGSGIGVGVAANKVAGARGGICLTEKQVRLGRSDDDMNILCLSADLVNEEDNKKLVKIFLETPFGSEERFVRRINKIKTYETKIG